MILRTSAVLLALLPTSLLFAQPAPAAPPAQFAGLPSATLQPSVEILKSAIGTANVDRWKASSAIKGEASANLRSIARHARQRIAHKHPLPPPHHEHGERQHHHRNPLLHFFSS